MDRHASRCKSGIGGLVHLNSRRVTAFTGYLCISSFLVPLSSCSGLAGPDYKRPTTANKAQWSEQPGAGSLSQGHIDPQWWNGFHDPELANLVDKAVAGNLDIRVLAARTGVAEATIDQARAGLLPTFTGGAATDTFKSTGRPASTQYSVAGEIGWEIDIWGKVRKGVEAQTAEFKASKADWRAGYLAMVADVATAFFQIRQLDQQAQQQQQTIASNEKILGIYRSMYGEGLVPETQVMQQDAQVSQLRNGLLEIQRVRKLTENGLATLLGMPADSLHVPPNTQTRIEPVPVPAGLPSDLLTRRPDLIAAEYRVLEAHDLAGQARLARLPSISLTGRGGSASLALASLLTGGTLGLSSLLSFPIFDPSVNAQIKVSNAQTRVAEEEYRRTVLRAFEEVENALTNLSSRKAQAQQLERRRAQLATVAQQVDAQLKEGLVSQLEVFEAQRTLLDARQSVLANHWQILSDNVALFKALGGGWPEDVVSASSD
jgi:outer membrane protein, multidrug efflux system